MTYFSEFKDNSIKLSAIYSVHDLTILFQIILNLIINDSMYQNKPT